MGPIRNNGMIVILLSFFLLLSVNASLNAATFSKYSMNPIFSSGGTGAWDYPIMGGAVLKDYDEAVNKFKLWYVGGLTAYNEGMSIGYATSPDGINWVKYQNNPVMTHGSSWDINGFSSGIHVIKDDLIYKLWYEGVDSAGVNRIGYATSEDGITWVPHSNNPVFSPGVNGAWDDDDVGDPSIIKEGTTYKMWYWGDNDMTDTDQIGLATSNDGINWQRVPSNPVISPDLGVWWENGEGVGTPHVIKNTSGYIMAYHAADVSDVIRIGIATSSDGLAWNKEGDPILDVGSGTAWDNGAVAHASLIEDGSILKLWYLGMDTSGTDDLKVGLAIECTGISIDIKGNNSDGPITVATNNTLSVTVTVTLSAGSCVDTDADWWVVESTPDGWYYYSLSTSWTSAGSSYDNLIPTFQGALFDLSTYEVLNKSELPEGTHTFYFAIDTNMNGSLDMGSIYYDSVEVNVKP